MSGFDSLSTPAIQRIAWMCGAAGRAQMAALNAQAQAAAQAAREDAEMRAAVEAALLAEWPKLAGVREKAQRGDYADDSDVLLTPPEVARLRYVRWRRDTGRMMSER